MISLSLTGSTLPSTWVTLGSSLVPHRVHTAIHMGDIGVIEAAEHMQDSVGLADIGQELVAEALTLAGALDKAGDIDYLHRCRHYPFGMHQRL